VNWYYILGFVLEYLHNMQNFDLYLTNFQGIN